MVCTILYSVGQVGKMKVQLSVVEVISNNALGFFDGKDCRCRQRKFIHHRGSICDRCRDTDSQAPIQPRYIENSSSDRLSAGVSGCSTKRLA